MLSQLAVALAIPALAVAQYGAPAAGGSQAPPAVPTATSATQHIISVAAGGQLTFSPNSITANVNDTVVFFFPPSTFTHSVTQSSFAAPCNLLNEGGSGQAGFNSGFLQNMEFTITVTNASEPIWYFCQQFGPPSHCGSGMVGVINPPTSGANTFQAFQAAAEKLGASFPKDTGVGGLLGVDASASGSAVPIPTVTAASSSTGGASQLVAGASSAIAALVIGFLFV